MATNILDLSEGKISMDEYNEKMGELAGEQLFDLLTMGGGKGSGALRGAEESLSAAKTSIKRMATGGEEALSNVKRSVKEITKDFVEGYKSRSKGTYLGTGAGGLQDIYEGVESGIKNALNKRNTSDSFSTLVRYGEHDLSRKAIEFRQSEKMFSGRNVAVFEYIEGKELRTLTRASERGVGHSERIIKKELEKMGVPKENVTRIYSELEPCTIAGGFCKQMIQKEFPQASVSHSFEYGATKSSRTAGVKKLKETVKELEK